MTLDYDFLKELPNYDGFMFGMPTRFGMMAGQMKTFFDSTGQLWASGALAGKLAATFVSTGTQQGGQGNHTFHCRYTAGAPWHGLRAFGISGGWRGPVRS